jgi:hypothetical protein
MDSARKTLSLGPLEISIRRREDGVRLGILASFAIHALIVLLFTIELPGPRTALEAEAVARATPPVPITFVDPLPAPPKPERDRIDARRPPPPARPKPLRMESVPEAGTATKSPPKESPTRIAGRQDSRPAGGEPGGPRTNPSPGVPPPASSGNETQTRDDVASNDSEPKDILGRLRAFKEAVEAPRPSTPHGPEGGGRGSGGITMPNLPATGFGIGNLEFEGRDYDWENYGRQIHGIIWRAWHNRLLITSSVFERWAAENRTWLLGHQNGVRFTILRTGKVVDVAIETPSGCYPLDDSATDALKEVVLPPLPEDFQRDSEIVHARFIAEGEIRTMKAFLQQMKNAGFF